MEYQLRFNEFNMENLTHIVESVLDDLAVMVMRKLKPSAHLNERYLHHLFTHKLQEKIGLISLDGESLIHPEWATRIKDLRPEGGIYKKDDEKKSIYHQADSGRNGYLDFAIGDFDEPKCGIEFKLDNSFNQNGIAFDFMKLLDKRNPIKCGFSFVVSYGNAGTSTNMGLKFFHDCLEQAIKSSSYIDNNRTLHLYAIEIPTGAKASIIKAVKTTGDTFTITYTTI